MIELHVGERLFAFVGSQQEEYANFPLHFFGQIHKKIPNQIVAIIPAYSFEIRINDANTKRGSIITINLNVCLIVLSLVTGKHVGDLIDSVVGRATYLDHHNLPSAQTMISFVAARNLSASARFVVPGVYRNTVLQVLTLEKYLAIWGGKIAPPLSRY